MTTGANSLMETDGTKKIADQSARRPLLFQLKDVRLSGDRTPRLQAESLEIRSGMTAILGYSGAGKTSLLNLLAGFEERQASTS